MEFLQTYAKELIALAIPLLKWGTSFFEKAKATLIWGTGRGYTYLINEPLLNEGGQQVSPTQTVHIRSLVIRNEGGTPAHNVEIVFNWKPMHVNQWPTRDVIEKVLADLRYVVIFPTLAPREMVGFELISINKDLPNIINVRSDESVAHEVKFALQKVVPRWKYNVARVLMIVGSSAAVYVLILAVQWLLTKTPLGIPFF